MARPPERVTRCMGFRYHHISNSHIDAIRDVIKDFSRCKVCGKWYIPFKDLCSDLNCCSLKCKSKFRREDSFDEEFD